MRWRAQRHTPGRVHCATTRGSRIALPLKQTWLIAVEAVRSVAVNPSKLARLLGLARERTRWRQSKPRLGLPPPGSATNQRVEALAASEASPSSYGLLRA